jgi:MFS family permease
VSSRQLWFLGCCHGLSYGSLITVGNWLPAILADTRAGSSMENWAVATGAMLLIGTAGRIFSGDVGRLMPRQMLVRRATLCIGVLYGLLALANSPLFVLLPAVALAVLCGGTYASIFTLTTDIASPAYVATAVGFMNMLANGVGIMLILALGNTREYSGGFGLGLSLIALAAAGLCAWGRSIDWQGTASA